MSASTGTTNQVRLSGTILAIAHHAAGSGYTIATLGRPGGRDITIKGRMRAPFAGMRLDCIAVPEQDGSQVKRWGPSFRITKTIVNADDGGSSEFLSSLGIAERRQARVFETLGRHEADAAVAADPYVLARLVPGFGFPETDAIAARLGIEGKDPRRLAAAIAHCLATEGPIICDEAIARDEADIAMLLREIALRRPVRAGSAAEAARLVRKASSGRAQPLDPDQELAAARGIAFGLSIMTGGPGTGKTTTLATMIDAMGRDARHVRLVAPTGKAAQRISSQSGRPAYTVHSLLGMGATEETAQSAKLEGARLVIADEASMLDVPLMAALCRAIPADCRLMLVGDPDQLPAIGPGRVLPDLIDSGAVPVTRLKSIHRQGEGSGIVKAAAAILGGRLPAARGKGFHIAETRDDASTAAVALAAAEGTDAIVLCPVKRGTAGTDALNAALQRQVLGAPRKGEGVETRAAPRQPAWTWRVGDAALHTRNDRKTKLVNGEVGTVCATDAESGSVCVSYPGRDAGVWYDNASLGDIIPAYAMTIHKSQGSEYERVVVAIPSGSSAFLSRMMLYTAVTRARSHVTLVGTRAAIAAAIANCEQARRHTALADLVSG